MVRLVHNSGGGDKLRLTPLGTYREEDTEQPQHRLHPPKLGLTDAVLALLRGESAPLDVPAIWAKLGGWHCQWGRPAIYVILEIQVRRELVTRTGKPPVYAMRGGLHAG